MTFSKAPARSPRTQILAQVSLVSDPLFVRRRAGKHSKHWVRRRWEEAAGMCSMCSGKAVLPPPAPQAGGCQGFRTRGDPAGAVRPSPPAHAGFRRGLGLPPPEPPGQSVSTKASCPLGAARRRPSARESLGGAPCPLPSRFPRRAPPHHPDSFNPCWWGMGG